MNKEYKRKLKVISVILILIVIGVGIGTFISRANSRDNITPIENFNYVQFLEKVENQEVESIVYNEHSTIVEGELKDGTPFNFSKPIDDFDKELSELGINVLSSNLETSSIVRQMFIRVVPTFLTLIFIGFFILYVTKKATKQQAGVFEENFAYTVESKVTFDDVAGNEEAKEELKELIDFIKKPQSFLEYGARAPKGTLLTGPPGNGKTLMAKALAGEAKVPFITVSGSDFVQMYVGVGASRIRALFKKANQLAPCIIFIDEIDALGRKRDESGGSSAAERDQTLNQLLVEMDGFTSDSGVLVIGATNRAELLDDALLRPGRFDRQTSITLPDLQAREEILKLHSKKKPINDDVDFKTIAKMTTYMSGADLSNVMNEASIYAAKSGQKGISMNHIDKAINKVQAGEERKNRHISKREKEITAYHEAGHALIAKINTNKSVPKVTIIPTTKGAGGYTLINPEEKSYESRIDMLKDISIALGGRIAEEIIFGEEYITSGAGQDLKVVTRTAERMVKDYGMSKNIGLINVHELYRGSYSGSTNDLVVNEIKDIIESVYEKTKELMIKNKDTLCDIADALLDKETLLEKELDCIIKGISFETEEVKEEEKIKVITEDRGSYALEEFFREKLIG